MFSAQAVALLSLAAVVLANDPYPAQQYKQAYKQDYYDEVSDLVQIIKP